ncbi:hypothetical protein HPP92_010429 [Vanilla planifolia]|uniref:Calmodulin binding protein-like N-terminal domain-containing protein n=1 Tax=Vanilla planifolia TaxID=51239 RepID=A0A835QYZ9_VANPL|nr:hypothetical protein HPP92_010429 [Vanilla planifolia]
MVEIVILDASNKIVRCGGLASAVVEIFVLDGDFNGDEHGQWANEDYTKHMVCPRKDKRPLLIGNLYIQLHDGIGYISDVKFTDNSSWMKSKTFKLGVKQCAGTEMVEEVQAGVSNAFRVKDRHGESNQKDYPPSMKDEIIQMPKGTWVKTLNHAIESKERCSSLLDCFVNFPPYQDPLEITGSNSLWTTNVLDEYVDHLPYYTDCEPPISEIFTNGRSQPASTFSFSSTKSSKSVHITKGVIAEQLDISLEFLMNGKERGYVPNKFDGVSLSSPCLWSVLIFVARWKIAALRIRKNKFLTNSLLENNADVLSYSNENEPSWEDLPPIICLSPL